MLTEMRPRSAPDTPRSAEPISARSQGVNPALAAAFNLRQYSVGRRRIADADRPVDTLCKETPLEYIDLLGGNGRWRQRKAEKEWERRRLEEEDRRKREKQEEEERRRRKAEMEARRRKQQEDEERRRQEERLRQIREQEERERRQREREERERLERERLERERLARLPRTCDTCRGSGKCTACDGKGCFFAMFLVSRVEEEEGMTNYGRMHQGCPDCGGYRQGILGELRKGTGRCTVCLGAGKIAPKNVDAPYRGRPAAMDQHSHSASALAIDSPGGVAAQNSIEDIFGTA